MKALPYLGFDGRCAEAFRFYQRTFGGDLEIMTHGDSPIADEVPDAAHDRVLHACLTVGEMVLMGSDAPPDWHGTPEGLSVSLQLSDVVDAERIFATLADGGAVEMPLGKTFWAERFGMVTDRFDIPWMVNCGPGT